MSFSISDLGNLQPSEPVDMSQLAPKGPSFPRKGKYTLQVNELAPEFTFGSTKAGYLSATIDPTIVGPTNEGYTIRFQKLSAKTFPETIDRESGKTRTTSQIARFLAACGDFRELPSEPAEVAEAVLAQSGRQFDALVDWRAYNKRTGKAVEGMENFPTNSYGEYTPWIEDSEDVDENGKPRRYRANLEVVRYLAKRG